MSAPKESRAGWSIEDAEQLMLSLKGVVAARLVTRPGGEVEEIHLLTTDEVSAKQTVRNVESALLAHLGLAVDHRKISVAQTKERPVSEPEPTVRLVPEVPAGQHRLLFYAHQVETERSHQVKHKVEIEWKGSRYAGTASAADLPRPRLEAVGRATLSAVEQALLNELAGGSSPPVTLALDGVKIVDAFDRTFVLVAVNALSGREVTPLAGAAVVEVSTDRAAILATLQATDRWVRGRV
ncbi:MAG: hypothetical protein ACYC6F_01265 [Longimicrobiales bacterium]